MSFDSLHVEAQQALDELRREELLPFPLVAHRLTEAGPGDYVIAFYDSRLRWVTVQWQEGESFKLAVRAAVLAGVARMGGPLTGTAGTTPPEEQ
ncbi:MAG TPA: hypothetical protein VGJ66_18955 [Pyrinomonadaceae bacterium]|jgi:hypothetical protein